MAGKKDHADPKKVFEEPDNLIRSRENVPAGPEELISIKRDEIISIAPDRLNWNNIYSGKTAGLYSIKPET